MNLPQPDTQRRRQQLVERVARSGDFDAAVLQAVGTVPREAFLPAELHDAAYRDAALPIDRGQTISQPSVVALMTDALSLTAHSKVLEIGTGSGYGAAILAQLAGEVYTVEQDELLAEQALQALEKVGISNVRVRRADGRLGWPEAAPFDAISVTASCDEVPAALLAQLKPQGRLVIPLGRPPDWQKLTRISQQDSGYDQQILATVKFVPFV